MVHVVSGLLKINKTTRENADSVRERERERERECILIWGESMIYKVYSI